MILVKDPDPSNTMGHHVAPSFPPLVTMLPPPSLLWSPCYPLFPSSGHHVVPSSGHHVASTFPPLVTMLSPPSLFRSPCCPLLPSSGHHVAPSFPPLVTMLPPPSLLCSPCCLLVPSSGQHVVPSFPPLVTMLPPPSLLWSPCYLLVPSSGHSTREGVTKASVIILTQLLLQNVQHRADELATPNLGHLPLFPKSCETLLSSGVPHTVEVASMFNSASNIAPCITCVTYNCLKMYYF